jgi:hypothetical protein
VIEGKLEGRIEMTGRRGRRRKRLLDVLKEKRRYWKLKEEALIAPCGELALEGATDLVFTTRYMQLQVLFPITGKHLGHIVKSSARTKMHRAASS